MITDPPTPNATPAAAPAAARQDLARVAQELEAAFLAEMLKHAGVGQARGAFGGGAGEDQFASMLRTEQARAIAENGGIGLAESVFQALLRREEAR